MAFKRVSDPVKFHDLKSLAKGTVCVQNGIYLGSKDGKFGLTHFWREKDGGKVGLSGGQLDYLFEQGELTVGYSYRVTFDGKEPLKKGPYAGKEVNKFLVDLDDESVEAADKKAAAAVPLAKVAGAAMAEELDDISL